MMLLSGLAIAQAINIGTVARRIQSWAMTFVTRTISTLRAIFLPLGSAKVILWLGIGLLLSVPAMAQAPVVSNVVAQQRPGTGLVDITYDLTAATATVAISLRVSSDGGATFAVPVSSLTGDLGTAVSVGKGKRITWNAGADWPEKWSDAMRFEVTADDGVIAPTIMTQPATQTIVSVSTATLTVTASGSSPLTYQWYQGAVGTTTTPVGTTVGTNSASFTTPTLSATTSYWVRVSNSAGSVNSTLTTISCSPTITTQPASQTIASGSTATLTVTASGSDPLTYQWYRGAVGTTTTPEGTNSASFTTPTLSATTSYWVRVSNSAGSVNSTLATISCSPTITTQPASQTIASGSTTTLTVTASGPSPLTYQWYRGAVGTTTTPVGTNSASFTTPTLSDTTSYWVRVSNSAGSVNSTLTTVETLALIPAGAFQMGRTSGDTGSNAPSVSVTVSAFYMGKNEVTKALWEDVHTWATANGYTDMGAGSGKATNHPVQWMFWWDVIKWCNARSEKEGLAPCYTIGGTVMKTGFTEPTVNWSANGYRLPTEAEWEKAARGGVSGKRFPWGTDTISYSQANYSPSTSYSYDLSGSVDSVGHPTYAAGSTPYTSPVGSFAANGYGLNDMAGNVSEWCWDWYGASTYVNGATDPRGAASGAGRVVRGGSWNGGASGCRAANRSNVAPTYPLNYVGFRVARSSAP
jgi:formylglycine-generating enzyme required for sulfatase activity